MSDRAKILLVDDNENLLETLGDILRQKGYRIETARTGKDALRKARERYFNVSLIDSKLPDIDGIEVLRAFREQYPARMNIIITAHATLETAVDALNKGANAFIVKPIDHEALDQMIKECLQKQRDALKISEETLAGFIRETMDVQSEEEDRSRLMQKYYRKLP